MPPPPEVQTPSLPRPGKAVIALMAVLFASSVVFAVVVNWAPGGVAGANLFELFGVVPERIAKFEIWRLFTSGFLTSPRQVTHVLWTLFGLYFLTPSLEKRWGGKRLVGFFLGAIVSGNVALVLGDRLGFASSIFHPPFAYGPGAALSAIAIAWATEYRDAQVRLFFVVPVSGRQLYWVTLGFCALSVIYFNDAPEGVIAPFGGIAFGVAMSGSPSPVRKLWLRLRLSRLQDQKSKLGKPPRKGGPDLRVVYGGLEEELGKGKPPKDKRYLN